MIAVALPAGLLFVFLIPWVLIRFVPKLDTIFHFPPLSFGAVNIILGILLILFGGVFALWSVLSQLLKADGTPVPIVPTKKLLVNGPFLYCRNPMTFGTILIYLGIGILVGSLAAILLVFLFGAALITYIKLVEEKELEMRFGPDYVTYKSATPFIIPRMFPGKRKE
jgi:protein-S-isoprenylcysteine O-methyltransferase Ste14